MISAWESLHFATLELVRSTPIKHRLVCAYRRHLASIPEDQLPGEVRESFNQVMAALHGVKPLRGEDAVAASVRKMSIQEADDCAALIVEIFGITCRILLNAARASAEVVQLHGLDRESGDFEESALIANK
ncbi:MAG: hypothetical protein QOG17_3182 [Gammaproteobacteria bacterium]|jgi:hypothetical protein|nr:hypothetical protein [Gammaproteobacteria bacterium]